MFLMYVCDGLSAVPESGIAVYWLHVVSQVKELSSLSLRDGVEKQTMGNQVDWLSLDLNFES